jgi:Nif-specific regulatory protein
MQSNDPVKRERDLYRRLLELGAKDDPKPFLEDALSLIIEVTGAKKGYLAIWGDESREAPRWWLARGFTDAELVGVERGVSSGIIAEAMATGQIIQTDSALDDPRFQEQQSVQLNQIAAVLCAPIGIPAAFGVLYLQGSARTQAFRASDKEVAELFVRHLAPYADRLRLREKQDEDHTKEFRQRLQLKGLIGKSRSLAEIFVQTESAARFLVPVLLTGASGTGKTALARAIHDNGPRAGKPFVELNCAAIPENLFESELFGALAGSHSTATKKMTGKVAAAQGGTLFLDELGELPMSVQSKLLQLLQSKEYFPLGGTQPEKANVRFIAATNADLASAVEKKTFREDLYYRLSVLTIRVPSLKERKEDIEPLARYFCENACQSYELSGLTIAPTAMHLLEETDWPGNIRQLGHRVETAVIRASMEGASQVQRHHIFPEEAPSAEKPNSPLTFQEATRRFQKKYLQEVLEAAQWNISETARRLDLTRTHIRTLINTLEITRAEKKG